MSAKKKIIKFIIDDPIKDQLGRLPIGPAGFVIKPKKGKGAYNRAKQKKCWQKEEVM